MINDKLIVQVFCDRRLELEHQIERALESYGLKNVHHDKNAFYFQEAKHKKKLEPNSFGQKDIAGCDDHLGAIHCGLLLPLALQMQIQ